jgi:L-lactate dehydrogenase (cytochrome)
VEGQEPIGTSPTMGSIVTPGLTWKDLEWIRETTNLPIVIKGIQTVEDAIIAYQHRVQGVVLSNHGGRIQDTYVHSFFPLTSLSFLLLPEWLSLTRRKTPCRTQSPLLMLLEIRKYAPFLLRSRMEIYLDGGIRRGSDVVKALALGATAVGLGRPFLYSLSGYGESGVRRMVQILRDEIVTNMALSGARNISELSPEMVNVSELERNLTGSIKL